ncbi:MAG: hybrid sensor histidine kinase/response regulator [Phycisphaerales bacterium]|nr:hybrid sensor histidine kinase/response regulator [Phycisphaerales bacterium]
MKATIFVVDDTVSCRRPMERLLNAEGYSTRSATNGLEALDALQSFIPDLMLLDLAMPVMDGFEVLERLRGTPRWASLPVIVVTGETLRGAEPRARELGAREVFLKAKFSCDDLFASIRRELAASQPV